MRWSVPKSGDLKRVSKFAWKPTRVGDEMVWLEFYWVTYEYVQCLDGGIWALSDRG